MLQNLLNHGGERCLLTFLISSSVKIISVIFFSTSLVISVAGGSALCSLSSRAWRCCQQREVKTSVWQSDKDERQLCFTSPPAVGARHDSSGSGLASCRLCPRRLTAAQPFPSEKSPSESLRSRLRRSGVFGQELSGSWWRPTLRRTHRWWVFTSTLLILGLCIIIIGYRPISVIHPTIRAA